MISIGTAQILDLSPSEIEEGFVGKAEVLFDDGTKSVMNEVEIFINRILWGMAIDYADSYITKHMNIQTYYSSGLFNGKCFSEPIGAIFRQYLILENKRNGLDKFVTDAFTQDVIELMDIFHNHVSFDNMKYVMSLHLDDLLDAQLYKPLLDSMVVVHKQPNDKNINTSYRHIREYMEQNPTNPLALMFLTKAIKVPQMNIMVGPRGSMSDIDDLPYDDVIPNSMLMGMNKASWYFQETRTIAKAYVQSKAAIQQSDKMVRTLQLVASVLSTITMEDCGSTSYRTKAIQDNGDLLTTDGKFYLDESTGKLTILSKYDTHLIGKKLKLRSVNHCNAGNTHHVCATCFGTMAFNLASSVNLGNMAVSVFGKKLIQGHLAKKHSISSAFGTGELPSVENFESILRHSDDQRFMQFNAISNEDSFFTVCIPEEAISVIHDEKTMGLVDPTKASIVDILTIKGNFRETEETPELVRSTNVFRITYDGNNGYFSNEFLSYMTKNTKYVKKEYIVDMSTWDNNDPFFYVLAKDYNFIVMNKDLISAMVNTKSIKSNNIITNMDDYIGNLEKIINRKMDINVSWIETFATTFAIAKDKSSIPRNGEPYEIMGKQILGRRSFGASSSHDDFRGTVMNPFLFEPEDMEDYPADILFRPDQALALESLVDVLET